MEAALQTRKARDIAAKKVSNYQAILMDLEAEPYEHAEARLQLPDAEKRLETLRTSLRRQERALGVDGLLDDYKKLASSQFLDLRMNACAVKMRIQE